jgi:hypothetical protein
LMLDLLITSLIFDGILYVIQLHEIKIQSIYNHSISL